MQYKRKQNNNKQKLNDMKTIRKQEFSSLGEQFRRAYKKANNTLNRVFVSIEGIKDDAFAIYPMMEITNNHVVVYIEGESMVITDANLKATIIEAR